MSCGGSTMVASPECTPAFSTCSDTAMASTSPSQATASTSISWNYNSKFGQRFLELVVRVESSSWNFRPESGQLPGITVQSLVNFLEMEVKVWSISWNWRSEFGQFPRCRAQSRAEFLELPFRPSGIAAQSLHLFVARWVKSKIRSHCSCRSSLKLERVLHQNSHILQASNLRFVHNLRGTRLWCRPNWFWCPGRGWRGGVRYSAWYNAPPWHLGWTWRWRPDGHVTWTRRCWGTGPSQRRHRQRSWRHRWARTTGAPGTDTRPSGRSPWRPGTQRQTSLPVGVKFWSFPFPVGVNFRNCFYSRTSNGSHFSGIVINAHALTRLTLKSRTWEKAVFRSCCSVRQCIYSENRDFRLASVNQKRLCLSSLVERRSMTSQEKWSPCHGDILK